MTPKAESKKLNKYISINKKTTYHCMQCIFKKIKYKNRKNGLAKIR